MTGKTKEDWLKLVLGLSDLFVSAAAEVNAEWSPDEPPKLIVAGEIGAVLIQRASEFSDAQLAEVFAVVEEVLTSEDAASQNAVATGLLEAMLAAGDRSPEALARVEPFLGAQAQRYCEAWNAFTKG